MHAAAVIDPAIAILVVTIGLGPACATVFIRGGEAIQLVVAEALGITQTATSVSHALHIAIIVGGAVVVNQIQNRSRRAARPQLDLIRLQSIVVADGMNETVAVGFRVQCGVRGIANTGDTRSRRVSSGIAVERSKPTRRIGSVGDGAAIARARDGRIGLAGHETDRIRSLDQVVY